MEEVWERLRHTLVLSYGATRNLSRRLDRRYADLNPVVRRQMTLFDPLSQIASVDALQEAHEPHQAALRTLVRLLESILAHDDLGLSVSLKRGQLCFARRRESRLALAPFELPDGFRSVVAWLADLCVAWHETATFEETADADLTQIAGIVLLDELDLHLHAKLQRNLVPRLRAALPNVQWLVTTHSPLVLFSFDKSELVLLDADSPGGVRALDRQILGFSADQVFEWLLDAPPYSSVMEQRLETEAGAAVAKLLYQSTSRNEEQAEQALAERRRLIERLRSGGRPRT